MRFISKWGRFGVCVRPQIEEAYAVGMAKTIQEPVYAMFHPGTLTTEERDLALSHWSFNGFYQEQDQVSIVPPDYRLGGFDSLEAQIQNGWSDEVRQLVDATLLDHSQRYDDVLAIPEFRYTPPWPAYDKYTGGPSALLRKLLDEEHDLQETLDYERQNQNRPKVIEELERGLAQPVQEEETILG